MKHYLTLDLKNDPDLIEQYKNWHNPDKIWKEIPEGIKKVGIREMEIFLWQNRLFMVIETADDFNWEEQMSLLEELPKQKEWELLMEQFQQKIGVGGKWQKMEQIFKLTDC